MDNQKTIGDVLSADRREKMQERLDQLSTKLEKYNRLIDVLTLEADLLKFRLGQP